MNNQSQKHYMRNNWHIFLLMIYPGQIFIKFGIRYAQCSPFVVVIVKCWGYKKKRKLVKKIEFLANWGFFLLNRWSTKRAKSPSVHQYDIGSYHRTFRLQTWKAMERPIYNKVTTIGVRNSFTKTPTRPACNLRNENYKHSCEK